MTEQKIIPANIEDEMRRSYLDYAMSVIVSRALPDVRDGLKPVQRRVMWTMHELGNTHDKPYKKSARVVGDAIGKYHPHGDQPVYDTIVRLAQSFSMRVPLIDGQGNFGSVDGDAPAAMRYTEVRLAPIAGMLLADIEKETVDFRENYDGSLLEPVVLPARFPNVLVNGAAGIAVGMSTSIPPHNLAEVLDATIHLVNHPSATVEDLLPFVQGPDFPTAGFICGRKGIRDAYLTGRGSVTMRARAAIDYVAGKGERERQAIVVTELPYQVNKASLLEKIAELVSEKKIEDIADLRDESDREGMRIVIELKRGAIAQVVLNNLFKHTPMQSKFSIIMLAIVNGQPQILDLAEILRHFIEHRREVVRRRTAFELRKAEQRAHILEGFRKALDVLDEVIALIRGAKSGAEAREGLMTRFALTQVQAQAILELQLQRLTGMERQKLLDEYENLLKHMAQLREILEKEARLRAVIVQELQEVRKAYSTPRRTQIVDEGTDFTIEDLIPDEDVAITITRSGYIKRTPVSAYRTQKRGGMGRRGMTTKAEDVVESLYTASTHSFLLIFTAKGQVYKIKVHEIPDAATAGRGRAIVNLIELPEGERVAGTIPVREFAEGQFIVFVTRRGMIKKTELSEYANIRSNGLIAMGVAEDDELIAVQKSDGNQHILISTFGGQAICFNESDVRPMGRPAHGVIGIRLEENDYVTGMSVVGRTEEILSLSELGLGKRTPITEYPVQHRGGKGVLTLHVTERTGGVVKVLPVRETDELMVITQQGQILRADVSQVRQTGRHAQGVKIITLSEGDRVVDASLVQSSGEESGED
jgi:DNA gyrase subunit A